MEQCRDVLTRFHTTTERPYALTAEQMRELDRVVIEDVGVLGPVLMERAALGVSEFILRSYPGRHTLVVCGRGNNGGDGLAAARQLHVAGHPVVCLVAADTVEQLSVDARLNFQAAQRCGVNIRPVVSAEPVPDFLLRETEVVVDCLLGTGAVGEIRKSLLPFVQAINILGAGGVPVVAVDIPSGVNATTGAIAADTVVATTTITFHAAKTGLVVPPGSEAAGRVLVWDIGLPRYLELGQDVRVVMESDVRVPGRRPDDHKYRAGYAFVVAGSAEYPGAALLAARAAARAGAGYVRLLAPEAVVSSLRADLWEITATGYADDMYLSDAESVIEAVRDPRSSALAVGPGLGREQATMEVVRRVLLESNVPAVVDADGLLAFAGQADLLARRPGLVLTPHAGELATLMEQPIQVVAREPLAAARAAAAATHQVVLLKGSNTVIAEPDGAAWVVVEGPPQLASAGTGDVLTGVICALLAKGLEPAEAARAAAWLHARAGGIAAASRKAGVTASDVLEEIPAAMAGRVNDRRPSWTG